MQSNSEILTVSFEQVKENMTTFASLINQYCEQIHNETGKPRPMICIIVVNRFKPYFSGSWMRNQINDKYKNAQRRQSGKKAWLKTRMKRLKDNAVKADSALKNALEEGTASD